MYVCMGGWGGWRSVSVASGGVNHYRPHFKVEKKKIKKKKQKTLESGD